LTSLDQAFVTDNKDIFEISQKWELRTKLGKYEMVTLGYLLEFYYQITSFKF